MNATETTVTTETKTPEVIAYEKALAEWQSMNRFFTARTRKAKWLALRKAERAMK